MISCAFTMLLRHCKVIRAVEIAQVIVWPPSKSHLAHAALATPACTSVNTLALWVLVLLAALSATPNSVCDIKGSKGSSFLIAP